MPNHEPECRSRSPRTGGLYGLVILSLLGFGISFASIVFLVGVPLALLATISPSATTVPWLWDSLRVVALFLSGVVTMLMAPRWQGPAPGVPVAVVRVVVVATLSLLPFPAIGAFLNPEYGLEPYSHMWMLWLYWVIGGLLASFLGRGQRASVAPLSTSDSIPLVAMVLGALGGILAVPFGIAFLRAPLAPRRRFGKGLQSGAGVVYSVLALLYLLFRTFP